MPPTFVQLPLWEEWILEVELNFEYFCRPRFAQGRPFVTVSSSSDPGTLRFFKSSSGTFDILTWLLTLEAGFRIFLGWCWPELLSFLLNRADAVALTFSCCIWKCCRFCQFSQGNVKQRRRLHFWIPWDEAWGIFGGIVLCTIIVCSSVGPWYAVKPLKCMFDCLPRTTN